MRIFFLFLFTAFISLIGASEIQISQNRIFTTDQGIFLNIDGNLTQAEGILFIGNGIYSATMTDQNYHGHCGRCGWPKNQNGTCSNRNCNGYGPNRD